MVGRGQENKAGGSLATKTTSHSATALHKTALKGVSLFELASEWRWQNAGKSEKVLSKDLKIKLTHLDTCTWDAITMVPRPAQ